MNDNNGGLNCDKFSSQVSLSVLVTREEYSLTYFHKKQNQSKSTALLIMLVSVLFIGFGLFGVYLASGAGQSSLSFFSFSLPISITFILVGVGGIAFSRFLLPIMYRGEGAKEFDSRSDLQCATCYEFKSVADNGNVIKIRNDWLEGEIPARYVTHWEETPTFILFTICKEIECAIPKRLLDDKQRELIVSVLK